MASDGSEEGRGLRLVLAPVALVALLLTGCAGAGGAPLAVQEPPDQDTADQDAADQDAAGEQPADQAQTGPCPAPSGDLPTPTTTPYDERPTADLAGADIVQATISTTCGDIVVALDPALAPTTVENFVALAEDGYYDGVGFHRVIDDFMIQGGDPTGTGTGCVDSACATQLPGYSFPDELGLAQQVVADAGGYPRGTVAMANRGSDTNGSQFFIVQASSPYPLPPAYAVFGEVVAGMDVVDRIASGPVDGQFALDPVVIRSVVVQR